MLQQGHTLKVYTEATDSELGMSTDRVVNADQLPKQSLELNMLKVA